MKPLRRNVKIYATLGVRHREPGLRTEERLVLHPDFIDPGHDHVGLENLRPATDLRVPHHIPARVQFRCLPRDGRFRVRHRLEDVVGDLDPLHRAAGRLGMVRGHQSDRLALVPHDVHGEHRLIRMLKAVAVDAGHVLVRQDRVNPLHGKGFGDVDAGDPGVRVRTAQGRAPQHVLVPQVRRVREFATHLDRAIGTPGTRPDPVRRLDRGCGGVDAHRASRSRTLALPSSRAISDSSSLRSAPSSATVSPPTYNRRTGGVVPSTRAATGSAIPA